MTNASTTRLILSVSLVVLLFATLPYSGLDVTSPAWADEEDQEDKKSGKGDNKKGDKKDKTNDSKKSGKDDKKSAAGDKKGDSAGKESRGGKGSKSASAAAAGPKGGNEAGAATASVAPDASTEAPGGAPESTARPAAEESNDDDDLRRGSNFFVGLDAYEQGDFDVALSHWLPLAENGLAAAQTGLGAVYYRMEQHADAFRWSLMAARQGETDAAHNLAVLYHYGLGTPFSMSQAMLWYGEAASRGSRKATLALRELRDGPLVGLVVPVPIPKPNPAKGFALHRLTEEAQILLATLGYDPGPIDGLAGVRTKAAVEQFEQDRGLFIRGRVSETLLTNLRRAIVEGSTTVISTR